MSDTPKQSLAVLRRIAEFLEELPADHLDDLAEGRARLTLIPWGSSEPLVPAKKPRKAAQPPATSVNVEDVVARLDAASSREEANVILNPLKVKDLKAVAAALRIPGQAGTKAALIRQIVELTVGARLSADAIRAL
jgi:hypothetical protein